MPRLPQEWGAWRWLLQCFIIQQPQDRAVTNGKTWNAAYGCLDPSMPWISASLRRTPTSLCVCVFKTSVTVTRRIHALLSSQFRSFMAHPISTSRFVWGVLSYMFLHWMAKILSCSFKEYADSSSPLCLLLTILIRSSTFSLIYTFCSRTGLDSVCLLSST